MENDTTQKTNATWNIKFDPERMVIVYDSLNNHKGEQDNSVEKTVDNMVEIAAKLNLPVETDSKNGIFQIRPGMTQEEGYNAWTMQQARRNKEIFIQEHKNRLAVSKTMTDEILYGILKADLPQYEQIGQKGEENGLAGFIVNSHVFQEKLAQSPEFGNILRDVKKAAHIYMLKEGIRNKQQDESIMGISFDSLLTNIDKENIATDTASDYGSLRDETLTAVSNEFYRRHKDNLAEVLGQSNLEMLMQIYGQNGKAVSSTLQDEIKSLKIPVGCQCFESKFGAGPVREGFIFIKELCSGKLPEKGDKVLLTANSVNDEKSGQLIKIDGFRYENGQYKHFYQEYTPREGRNVEKNINLTKGMHQKISTSKNKDEDVRQ